MEIALQSANYNKQCLIQTKSRSPQNRWLQPQSPAARAWDHWRSRHGTNWSRRKSAAASIINAICFSFLEDYICDKLGRNMLGMMAAGQLVYLDLRNTICLYAMRQIWIWIHKIACWMVSFKGKLHLDYDSNKSILLKLLQFTWSEDYYEIIGTRQDKIWVGWLMVLVGAIRSRRVFIVFFFWICTIYQNIKRRYMYNNTSILFWHN